MSSQTFPDISSAKPLPDLVSELEKYVNEVRRAGAPAAILGAANAAADAIGQRVGVCSNDAERAALTAVRRFTFMPPLTVGLDGASRDRQWMQAVCSPPCSWRSVPPRSSRHWPSAACGRAPQ